MKITLSLLSTLLILAFFQKCGQFDYGTQSPEALAHYHKGWEQILDQGQWTKAEESFRKAVDLDSSFYLAWSQVGRISHNQDERAQIFKKLTIRRPQLFGWEHKLLEVYLGSLQLIDSKDRGLTITPEQVKKFYSLSESHFSDFLKAYPDEVYVQSEFIEVIHGIYGPQAALDSMKTLSLSGKKLNPFLISYTAQLLGKIKDFEGAFQAADELKNTLKDLELPIIPFTYASIHFEKGEYSETEKYLDQVLNLDPKHTLAQRLKNQVENKLKEIGSPTK